MALWPRVVPPPVRIASKQVWPSLYPPPRPAPHAAVAPPAMAIGVSVQALAEAAALTQRPRGRRRGPGEDPHDHVQEDDGPSATRLTARTLPDALQPRSPSPPPALPLALAPNPFGPLADPEGVEDAEELPDAPSA